MTEGLTLTESLSDEAVGKRQTVYQDTHNDVWLMSTIIYWKDTGKVIDTHDDITRQISITVIYDLKVTHYFIS